MESAVIDITKTILPFLTSSDFTVETTPDTITGSTRININIDDAKTLIGKEGVNLQALDHIIRKIAETDDPEEQHFLIDINNYKKQKNEEFASKIKLLAGRVRDIKSDLELNPMTSYERMMVHAILAEEENIKTESSGFGRERHIVIKYSE